MRSVWRLTRFVCHWLVVACPALASGDSQPYGNWITLQDGKPIAVVRLEERGARLFGTVVRFVDPRLHDPRCHRCEGHRQGMPIRGMQVLWDLKRDGDEWSGGYVLDPTTGKVYDCQLELVDGGSRLELRAYVGMSWIGRTLIWKRAHE
jgi:uncharacterized protein (DUF2147 family)